ncbi:MAG: response regulator [Terracidiphilus sp.]|jgi:CheY-like chemotaxis protein
MLNFSDDRQLPTVLLIDDDFVSREVTATVLTMSGYTVHTAADGAESLKLLADGACVPEVILMDAQMPGLSGIGLIGELRARSLATIVAISGSCAPGEVAAAADGFLLKPFGAEDLDKLLKEHAQPAAVSGAPAGIENDPSAERKPLPESGEQVVDVETLAQLREMMPEAKVREIYEAIVADLGRRLDALQVAIAKDDAAEVRRLGHAIKGGCGMAGALEAARLGAAIEAGALETGSKGGVNHLDNRSPVLSDLRAATHNLKRMLKTEFPA